MKKKQNSKKVLSIPANVKEELPESKPKFTVQAGSLTAKTSPILPVEATHTPTVFYTPKAWTKIRRAVDKCTKEVGWLGIVERQGDDYLIEDIFIPKQTVSHTETDIDAEDMVDLVMSLEEPDKLLYWGHSHVNMGVSPSGQDEQQTAEYLEHADFFIRGIYNKKGEAKVDVFDMKLGLVFQKVSTKILYNALTEEEEKAFEAELNKNVIERTYQTSNYGAGGMFDDWPTRSPRYAGQPEKKEDKRSVGRLNPFVSRSFGGGWNG
ncbi:MAG: hypothetical protein PVI03_07925 [Candidatus Thorarchaeota archaeon]|jgi:hypothetical protein